MNAIWKYTLRVTDHQSIEMPIGAKILSCQTQNEVITLWVMLKPNSNVEMRHIRIIGTGHLFNPNDGNLTFIDTVQMSNGSLIWHVFELT